ncbi:hypothetical protein [Variovorax sp. PBL-H6]|uniref:hypothetical protein n=1 Tax=Variovorax sp. PBL-H6 TaxID=434009 RepID=UPI0013A52F8B|nr:hypothetical protein [Variovorax sp. PBL-H6]
MTTSPRLRVQRKLERGVVGHPLGMMRVKAKPHADAMQPQLHFETLSFPRKARPLTAGDVFVPNESA